MQPVTLLARRCAVSALRSLLRCIARTCFADVQLQADERENLGIQTEAVQMLNVARQWSAAATVLDAGPLVAVLADLRAAESAADASHEEFRRAEQLYQNDKNVARKTRDAARTQSITDEGRVVDRAQSDSFSLGPADSRDERLGAGAAGQRSSGGPRDARACGTHAAAARSAASVASRSRRSAAPRAGTPTLSGRCRRVSPSICGGHAAYSSRSAPRRPTAARPGSSRPLRGSQGRGHPASAIVRWHGASGYTRKSRPAPSFVARFDEALAWKARAVLEGDVRHRRAHRRGRCARAARRRAQRAPSPEGADEADD